MCKRPILYLNPRLPLYDLEKCREVVFLGQSYESKLLPSVFSTLHSQRLCFSDFDDSLWATYACQSSFLIDPNGHKVPILVQFPCNHCSECSQQYQSEIRKRAIIEGCNSTYVVFYTLTYDDEHLPDHGLCKQHCVSAFKNLRNHINRYISPDIHFTNLYVGEYGTDDRYTYRPHYHGLLFFYGNITDYHIRMINSMFMPFDKSYFYQLCVADDINITHWWPYGQRFDFQLPKKSVAALSDYCSKYVTKQYDDYSDNNFLTKIENKYNRENSWFNRPFVQMPHSIGLGCRYLSLYRDYILSGNYRLMIRDSHGHCSSISLPRIFIDKLFVPVSKLQPSSFVNYSKWSMLIKAFTIKLRKFEKLNSKLFNSNDIDSKIYHNRDYVTSYLKRIQSKYSVYERIRLTRRQRSDCESIFRSAMKLHFSEILLWIMDIYQHYIRNYLPNEQFFDYINSKSRFIESCKFPDFSFQDIVNSRQQKSNKLFYEVSHMKYSLFDSFR